MEIPRPHPRLCGSESMGAELGNLHFNRYWGLFLLVVVVFGILRFEQIQAPLVCNPGKATSLFRACFSPGEVRIPSLCRAAVKIKGSWKNSLDMHRARPQDSYTLSSHQTAALSTKTTPDGVELAGTLPKGWGALAGVAQLVGRCPAE